MIGGGVTFFAYFKSYGKRQRVAEQYETINASENGAFVVAGC